VPNPNTAKFPSELPTDNDLQVASRRAIGNLDEDITTNSTTFRIKVGQGLRFQVPCLIQVDQEIMRVKAKTGDILQQIDRGFAGSNATPHSTNTEIRGYILDWHHNQMAAEIKAIAQALGIHLANVVRHVDVTSNGDITGVFNNLVLKPVGTAGTYGGPGKWLQITTDSKGRVVLATNQDGYRYFPIFYKAAILQGTNAVLGFSFANVDAPNAVPVTGTNGTIFAVASFTQTNEYWVQDHFTLPEDWDDEEPITVDIIWRINETSGNVKWKLWTTSMRNGSNSDPAFQLTPDSVTTTVPTPAYTVVRSIIPAMNVNGFQAGDEVFFKFARAADDTAAASAELIALRFNIARKFTLF
jgi:hypothetical protein